MAKLLHRYGALALFDYATAGPYVPIDMNPKDEACAKDAVFLSPHKFLGGPGSPGILVIKKRHVVSSKPIEPGGGTVKFVGLDGQVYVDDLEELEEGGTPEIVGSIRAALAFRLKASIGEQWILQRETQLRAVGVARLRGIGGAVPFLVAFLTDTAQLFPM